MSKKQVLSEDLICHGSSELSMHNFLSSLGTWLGVKNAMPWKEKKLLVQDYWERLSQALLHSLRPEQKKILHFSAISEVCPTDQTRLFPFQNHKKSSQFPSYTVMGKGNIGRAHSVLTYCPKQSQFNQERSKSTMTHCAKFFACAGQSSFIPSHCSLSFFRLVLLRQFKKSTSRAGLLHTRSALGGLQGSKAQWQFLLLLSQVSESISGYESLPRRSP